MPKPPPKKKTSLAVRPDLWHALRLRAFQEGRPAFALLEDALAAYLRKPLRKGGR
jgi:hypothetical protein